MKIITGTVVGGRIEVDGRPFAEGEKVTVLGSDGTETFSVTQEEKRLLLASIAQADAGKVTDGEQLLGELDRAN